MTQRTDFQRKEQGFISVRPSSALKMWVQTLFQFDTVHEAGFKYFLQYVRSYRILMKWTVTDFLG